MTTTVSYWINEYGSTMDLWQWGSGGGIIGVYRSSTGSTGTYAVVGQATGPVPSDSAGQPVALSIFWRSLDGGEPDPSWNWVSGLGGQRLPVAGGQPETLLLNHALVATTPFPGLAQPGTYIDKLSYRPRFASPAESAAAMVVGGTLSDPVVGVWQCREQPGLWLKLVVNIAALGAPGVNATGIGFVTGSLVNGEGEQELIGLTDTGAAASGLALQGLTLSAAVPGTVQTLSLSGSLDLSTRVMTMTALTSQGTAPDATYVQTTVGTLTFVQA